MVLRQDLGWQGQDGVLSEGPVPGSSSAVLDGIMWPSCAIPRWTLCAGGAHALSYGWGPKVKTRQSLHPPLGTHTAQWEASSCHHPPPVQSQLPQRCPRLWHGSADGFPRVHWRPATLLEPKKMMSYKERLLGSRRGQVCYRETTAGLHGV